ncbi:MAG: hypothetical protein IJO72_02480 [Oscillospiraceae bacterium]|nr:hypothetical protein [Oscillospiraceae bacterium]
MDIFNIETLADFAELVSAVAAILTVILAAIELYNRGKDKRAEVSMDIYSDFLLVKQQLQYAADNVKSFSRNVSHCTDAELTAFVRAHHISPSVFTTIQKLSKQSISSFDCLKAEGKETSTLILNLSIDVTDLLLYINTFFQANAHGGPYDAEKIDGRSQYVASTYQKLLPALDVVGETLHKNLIKTRGRSNTYLTVLFVVLALLLFICAIL